jgi:hypothetical protein
MAEILTKYSDYVINSIEFFISKIEEEILYRDLPGLTDNKIEIINVTKEHPLVSLMASELNPQSRTSNLYRSNILPSISVTPGNITDKGFSLGNSPKTEVVNDEFIEILKSFLDKTDEEIQQDVLLTKNQIELIISQYKRSAPGTLRVQTTEWRKSEEINISVWSESTDVDVLLGNLTDSILASIQIGFLGDNSRVRDFKYNIAKGLTNFNYGRVLFGSEYNLTFLNSYTNYIIYVDEVLSGHDLIGTFLIPGE